MCQKPKAHKKEKQPKKHKEKKSGIRQKQKQNQIVNVTVNNGDGGGGGSKRPGQIPLPPLNIFDPSLITPHYGVNDRQPVNPPDPENVDMTELLTRLTAQYQPTKPIPNDNISNVTSNNVQQPITVKEPPIKIKEPPVKIKESPIKIKADDVQPIIQNEAESKRMIENKKKLEELKNKLILQVAEQIPPKDKKPKIKFLK